MCHSRAYQSGVFEYETRKLDIMKMYLNKQKDYFNMTI